MYHRSPLRAVRRRATTLLPRAPLYDTVSYYTSYFQVSRDALIMRNGLDDIACISRYG